MSDTNDRVSRMVRLSADPDLVWAEVGGFGAVADWHPLIEAVEVEEIEGETYRRLTLADGESIFERLAETGPRRHSYEMVEGPLPVSDYRATFACVAEPGGGCHLYWSAVFEPAAGHEEAVDAIVGRIFETGLAALAERFG